MVLIPAADGCAVAGSALLTGRWYAAPATGSLCHRGAVPMLALSVFDVLIGIGLAVAGFVVVALVCVAVLAMIQLILPSTDAGAAEIDRLHPPEIEQQVAEAEPAEDGEVPGVDTEANA